LNKSASDSISKRTAAGATTLIVSRLLAKCIDLVTLFVLGRLLSPADFGLVAIAMSIIMVVEAVMELPVGQALVRLSALDDVQYDTAFTLAVARGLGLALFLAVISWPLAQIYHDDRLIALICALGIAPAARGLGSVRIVDYAKKLDFRPSLICEFVGKSAASAISVMLAWKTGSYWSIAAGTIATPIIGDITSYVIAPYRPNLTLRAWRDFANFLGWSTASQLVTALNWQMDQLLLGRFVNQLYLGHFSMAANVATLPIQVIVVQAMNPLLVAFSIVRDDHSRLIAAYRNSAEAIVGIGLPVMVGMSLVSETVIRIVLGEQWIGAAPMLRWLSLAVAPSLFIAPLASLSMALNQTRILFRLSVIEFAVKFPLMLYGSITEGVTGVIAARALTAIVMAACSMFAVRGLIQLPLRSQLFGPWRPILGCAVMTAAVLFAQAQLVEGQGFVTSVIGLAEIGTIGAVAYAATVFLLWFLAGRPDGFEAKFLSAGRRYLQKHRETSAQDDENLSTSWPEPSVTHGNDTMMTSTRPSTPRSLD
jgi:O-antigen/teichoic acid export membrane protein